MKHNLLHSVQEKILGELENKRTELRANVPIPQELKFIYHTKELEEQIDHLGEIVLFVIPSSPPKPAAPPKAPICIIPDYASVEFYDPTVAVGKYGSAPGEI